MNESCNNENQDGSRGAVAVGATDCRYVFRGLETERGPLSLFCKEAKLDRLVCWPSLSRFRKARYIS